MLFPYPNGGRRYFDQLIVVDELKSLFERVRDGRRQQYVLVASRRSNVGEFFLFHRTVSYTHLTLPTNREV